MHTATGSVLRSAEVDAAAEAPGKLMLAPLEASLPVLVWEDEDEDDDDDDDDEDSSSVQNLRVQPGTRLSRHRHLLQSTIQVSPACLGSPRSLVPHWLAGRVSLDLSSENIASLVVVASTSSSGRQNLRVQPGTRLSRHRHLLQASCPGGPSAQVSPATRGRPRSLLSHWLVPSAGPPGGGAAAVSVRRLDTSRTLILDCGFVVCIISLVEVNQAILAW